MQKRDPIWRKLLRGLVIAGLLAAAVMVVIVVGPDPILFLGTVGVILIVLYYARSAWSDFQVWMEAVCRGSLGK